MEPKPGVLGEMADSRAEAVKIQNKPETSCARNWESVQKKKKVGEACQKHIGWLYWAPTDLICDNLSIKIIKGSNGLQPIE